MENKFVFYPDLFGKLWLGKVESADEIFVGVEGCEYFVKTVKCFKVPEHLCKEDLLGYSYYELNRNRKIEFVNF